MPETCPKCGAPTKADCGTFLQQCQHYHAPGGIACLRRQRDRLKAAILDFLEWENEREHNDDEWMEATEKLAEAVAQGIRHA